MTVFRSTYNPKLFRAFKSIESHSSQSVLQFYKEHENSILKLDFDEFLEIHLSYLGALFDTGNYATYKIKVQEALEVIIDRNITSYKGVDIYRVLLLKKAAAHFHLLEMKESENILKQLIQMDNSLSDYTRLLHKVFYKQTPLWLHHSRAVCVGLFLFSASVIMFEIFVVGNFLPEYMSLVRSTRNSLFVSGVLILVLSDLGFRVQIQKKISALKFQQK